MSLKSFSLSIIDFLGVMIPGFVWVSLLFYANPIVPLFQNCDLLKLMGTLDGFFPNNEAILHTVVFITGSYLIGYLSRLAAPEILDFLTIFIAWLRTGQGWKKVMGNKIGRLMHPYDFLFENQIGYIAKQLKDTEPFGGDLRYFKVFFICKRILLQYSQNLWLEAERREAEVRFINGMFYPTLAAAVLFFYSSAYAMGAIFTALTLFLAFAFRRRRYAEASFVFSSVFVLLGNKKWKIP